MEFAKTSDSLNTYDSLQTFYNKLSRMSLNKLEEEAKKFNRYAELSQIINCYLIIKNHPEMKMEMIFDEGGWCLKNCNRINLNFEPPLEDDVKILKVVKIEKD